MSKQLIAEPRSSLPGLTSVITPSANLKLGAPVGQLPDDCFSLVAGVPPLLPLSLPGIPSDTFQQEIFSESWKIQELTCSHSFGQSLGVDSTRWPCALRHPTQPHRGLHVLVFLFAGPCPPLDTKLPEVGDHIPLFHEPSASSTRVIKTTNPARLVDSWISALLTHTHCKAVAQVTQEQEKTYTERCFLYAI